MGTGAITQYVDVAQLVLYLFWLFFFGLIWYLQAESHREGYPMEVDGDRPVKITGWPIPGPKTFLLAHGGEVTVPNDKVSPQRLMAEPSHPWIGAPLVPTGDKPMLDGIGPGAWADRADVPDLTWDGDVKIVPLRVTPDYSVSPKDVDPRGLDVTGADDEVAGVVRDIWIDKAEVMFRYLEVEIAGGRHVLLPMNFSRITRRGVKVHSILAEQFADVPGTKHPEQITFLEEEKVMAYYGAGTLYATPSRAEPLV